MISKPSNISFLPTQLFGVPKLKAGRHNVPISAVVIHCVDTPLEQYDSIACGTEKLKIISRPHVSSQYAIGVNGEIHQYVENTNVAWSFARYTSNFPQWYPLTNLHWPSQPNVLTMSPDFFSISIVLTSSQNHEECTCGKFENSEQRSRLVHLLAWLAQEYSLPLTTASIQFSQNIDSTASSDEKECLCDDIDSILSDAQHFCEICQSPIEQLPVSQVSFILGTIQSSCPQYDGECLVKEPLSSLISRLDPCQYSFFAIDNSSRVTWIANGPTPDPETPEPPPPNVVGASIQPFPVVEKMLAEASISLINPTSCSKIFKVIVEDTNFSVFHGETIAVPFLVKREIIGHPLGSPFVGSRQIFSGSISSGYSSIFIPSETFFVTVPAGQTKNVTVESFFSTGGGSGEFVFNNFHLIGEVLQ